MEEEGADALEMAAQADEERKAKEKDARTKSRIIVLVSIFYFYFTNNIMLKILNCKRKDLNTLIF